MKPYARSLSLLPDQLWCMNFYEVLADKELSKQLTDTWNMHPLSFTSRVYNLTYNVIAVGFMT